MTRELKEVDIVKVKLRKIDVRSITKFQTIFFTFLGILFWLIVVLYNVILNSSPYSPSFFRTSNFLWTFIFPLIGAIIGFLSGIIITFLFNLALKINKGLKINLEEIEEKPKSSEILSSY